MEEWDEIGFYHKREIDKSCYFTFGKWLVLWHFFWFFFPIMKKEKHFIKRGARKWRWDGLNWAKIFDFTFCILLLPLGS